MGRIPGRKRSAERKDESRVETDVRKLAATRRGKEKGKLTLSPKGRAKEPSGNNKRVSILHARIRSVWPPTRRNSRVETLRSGSKLRPKVQKLNVTLRKRYTRQALRASPLITFPTSDLFRRRDEARARALVDA